MSANLRFRNLKSKKSQQRISLMAKNYQDSFKSVTQKSEEEQKRKQSGIDLGLVQEPTPFNTTTI
eukprot:Pgem_evm1s13023